MDLLPTIARLWFTQRLTEVNLSRLQMAVLICLGLQHKNVDDLATEFRLPSTQVLALFNKAVRKLVTAMNKIQEQEVRKQAQRWLQSRKPSFHECLVATLGSARL